MNKILLVDDQKMFIDGMEFFLESEKQLKIVGTATNGEEVISFLESHPDTNIVIMDVEMPVMDGIEATKAIRKDPKLQDVKILVLTMYNEKKFIVELLKAGANGYILKNKSKEELVQAIQNVSKGQPHFSLEVLAQATSNASNLDKAVELTEREHQILCHIAEGKTTKEIAQELNITEGTVNTHRKNLLRKLEFPNDKFLVRYAIKQGYVKL